MSFPHFGHPYGGASQVRAAPMGDGGRLEGRRAQCRTCPQSPPLSRVPREARESRDLGSVPQTPLTLPHPWQRMRRSPRQAEESCDPKLGHSDLALREVGEISGTFQTGLLAVQISEVAGRVPDSVSLFFWARSFVILCSSPLPSMGRSKLSASGSFDFPDLGGHCAMTGSPGKFWRRPPLFSFSAESPRTSPSLTSALLCDLG